MIIKSGPTDLFVCLLMLIPLLKVTDVYISLVKNVFKSSVLAEGKEKSKSKLKGKNLLEKCLLIRNKTRIKLQVNPGLA